jgi:glycosyltransferase involved in cell wall biosynthesis
VTAGDPEALRPPPFTSLVVPVFNEEEVLPMLLERLRALSGRLPGDWEAVFVDDGSRDRSASLLFEAHSREPRIRVVQLSRNFGQAAAITAGIDHAQGDVVVLLDADLQDPPDLIPEMVDLYRRGFEAGSSARAPGCSTS